MDKKKATNIILAVLLTTLILVVIITSIILHQKRKQLEDINNKNEIVKPLPDEGEEEEVSTLNFIIKARHI